VIFAGVEGLRCGVTSSPMRSSAERGIRVERESHETVAIMVHRWFSR
jgi:hypothetical protein